MAIWVDFFKEKLEGSKVVVDAEGKPYVSKEMLNISQQFLPYHIYFRRFDVNGVELENRLFAQVGDRDLALKSFNDLTSKRLNSFELVLDGE